MLGKHYIVGFFKRLPAYLRYKLQRICDSSSDLTFSIIKAVFFKIAFQLLRMHTVLFAKPLESQPFPMVLVLRNRFYTKSSLQLSTEYYQIDKTIEQSELANVTSLCYESIGFSPLCDIKLYLELLKTRPKYVVLSSWGRSTRHPDPRTIKLLRECYGVKFIAVWWDTCSKSFEKRAGEYINAADLNVAIDNPRLLHITAAESWLALWAPQDDELYAPARAKDVDVSFLGQIGDYRSNRAKLIESLKASGVDGIFSTSDRPMQVSHKTYAEVMGRSKIVINFSKSVDGHQSKGRVMEAIRSGALVLESINDQTSELFVPNEHYVTFENEHDLLQKINYYLQNPDERLRIATSAREFLLTQYTNKRFWARIFDSLEANINQ